MRTEITHHDILSPAEPFGVIGAEICNHFICDECDHEFSPDDAVFKLPDADLCEDCFHDFLVDNMRKVCKMIGGDVCSAQYFMDLDA